MQFALAYATPTRALLLPSQCFPQVRDRLRGVLTGHRRPRARDTARHCHIWYQFSNGTFFISNGSHTTHGAHLNTQGVRLSLYQRYRYSLSSGTQGAGAVRYRPSSGTGGAGTGGVTVLGVLGALRY